MSICKKEYQCEGMCMLNIACMTNAWDIIAPKCKGTLEEQKLLNDGFYRPSDREKVVEKFKLEGKEKEKVLDSWS